MKQLKISTARYKQLLRKEKALLNGVKPLVEKLHNITRQHHDIKTKKQNKSGDKETLSYKKIA